MVGDAEVVVVAVVINEHTLAKKIKQKKCYILQWHISDECNLNCYHSYQDPPERSIFRSEHAQQSIIDLIFSQ